MDWALADEAQSFDHEKNVDHRLVVDVPYLMVFLMSAPIELQCLHNGI